MRIYKLLTRYGERKRRLWPWFKPPETEPTIRYYGWAWDPAIQEWVWDILDKIEVEVEGPKYPKPTSPPRPEQPINVYGWYWTGRKGEWNLHPLTPQQISEGITRGPKPTRDPGPADPIEVEGWGWDERLQEWYATIIVGQRVDYVPPRTLPPNVTQEAVFELYSFDQLFIEEVNAFVAQGYTLEAARRITRQNFDPLIRMMWAKSHSATQSSWQSMIADIFQQEKIAVQDVTMIALLIVVAAAVGYVIGTILQRLTFDDDFNYYLVDTGGTYLLGPGNWRYSKHIGTSVGGINFYSRCQDIGTEYVRHKRARSKAGYDVIDFPGGFLETGYDAPYFVKYRWSHWKLQYIGMLESRGSRFYSLKKADHDPFAAMRPGTMIKSTIWCKDFHYYL